MLYIFTPLWGNGYQFWSGIGSDFGELTLVTAVVAWYIHNQCHVDTCHRIGKHPFQHYKLCPKHSPHVPKGGVSHYAIVKLWKEQKKKENSVSVGAESQRQYQSTPVSETEQSKGKP